MLVGFVRLTLALSVFNLLYAAAASAATSPSAYTTRSPPLTLTRRNIALDSKAAGLIHRTHHRRFQRRDADSAGPDEASESPQVLGWDDGLGVWTIDASVGGRTYHMIPTFGQWSSERGARFFQD